MVLFDGKQVSEKLLNQLCENVTQKPLQKGRAPRLDIILVGDDYASVKYVEMKRKKAEQIGISSVVHRLEADVLEQEVLEKISELNSYDEVDGFMIQLPLPKHLNEDHIVKNIDPSKDVDGMTAENLGLLFWGNERAIASATPRGIITLLKEYEIELAGKSAVILGRSKIVGLPLAAILNRENCTVTIAHSKTKDVRSVAKEADILISAVGMPNYVDETFVKQGAVVIDVGTNKDPDTGLLVGDVNFKRVAHMTSYITPVPGGVGPMTIVSLMQNLMDIVGRH